MPLCYHKKPATYPLLIVSGYFLLAQVGFDHLGIVLDLFGCSFGEYFAENERLDSLAKLHDKLQPVLYE